MYHRTTYTKIEAIFSFVSFAGVVFIIRPDLFVTVESVDQSSYGYAEGTERFFWMIVFFVALIFWSGSVVMMKALKDMETMAVNLPFGICTTIAAALLQISFEQVNSISFPLLVQLVVVMEIATFLNQHTYVRANQLGKPAKLALLTNLYVVLGFLFEIFYLGESQPWFSSIGALLILGSSIVLAVSRL